MPISNADKSASGPSKIVEDKFLLSRRMYAVEIQIFGYLAYIYSSFQDVFLYNFIKKDH